MRQASGGDGRFAPTPGGCSLDAVRGYHATLTIFRERCRAEALLIGVTPVHRRDFFANVGTEAITFQLDVAEERR